MGEITVQAPGFFSATWLIASSWSLQCVRGTICWSFKACRKVWRRQRVSGLVFYLPPGAWGPWQVRGTHRYRECVAGGVSGESLRAAHKEILESQQDGRGQAGHRSKWSLRRWWGPQASLMHPGTAPVKADAAILPQWSAGPWQQEAVRIRACSGPSPGCHNNLVRTVCHTGFRRQTKQSPKRLRFRGVIKCNEQF